MYILESEREGSSESRPSCVTRDGNFVSPLAKQNNSAQAYDDFN
jgi:hypothetical protein